jgi:GTP cyclohydrolase II
MVRKPIVACPACKRHRNAIGSYGGPYAIYRGLTAATTPGFELRRPDLTNTQPIVRIGPFSQWSEPGKIVALDPFGHLITEVFADYLRAGVDVRPTTAVTQAQTEFPDSPVLKTLKPDGKVLLPNGKIRVTKVACDPVWDLEGIAARLRVTEGALRRALYRETGGMFPQLVRRRDLKIFLPPIGGFTAYLFGDNIEEKLADPKTIVACRVHDECNGSDVFMSDICTCRPYLVHAAEVCVETAMEGGIGIIIYNRKEGRALGEVTKYLVYNARKRQEGCDRADTYFRRTDDVACVVDARNQELMPDALHLLGIRRIDRWVSMSNMKRDALENQGIEIVEQIPIPQGRVPDDANVELEAKKAAGYYAPDGCLADDQLCRVQGRSFAA